MEFFVFPEFIFLAGKHVFEGGIFSARELFAEKRGSEEEGLEKRDSKGENIGFFFIEFFFFFGDQVEGFGS